MLCERVREGGEGVLERTSGFFFFYLSRCAVAVCGVRCRFFIDCLSRHLYIELYLESSPNFCKITFSIRKTTPRVFFFPAVRTPISW